MIVNRKPLTLWEQLYLPAIIGGFKVTLRHASVLFGGKNVTMEYPEQKWAVPADYRGAPYLVKDQEDNTKCVSCQFCEFVCPPKAIQIVPPGPAGQLAGPATRKRCRRNSKSTCSAASSAAFARKSARRRPSFCMKDYSLTGTSREEMIYDKEKLLALGGVHGGVQKWKHKLEEAEGAGEFSGKSLDGSEEHGTD